MANQGNVFLRLKEKNFIKLCVYTTWKLVFFGFILQEFIFIFVFLHLFSVSYYISSSFKYCVLIENSMFFFQFRIELSSFLGVAHFIIF